jgi:hypothetical protein
VKYREAVKAGLLMYNPAFEAAGIKDAIEVRQMPDDADWDLADVRYNVIRWTDGLPFAIALFRTDPRTGEILNAAIGMDSGFALSGAIQFDIEAADPRGYFPGQFPEWEAEQRRAKAGAHAGAHAHKPGVLCKADYLTGAAREAEFGRLALGLLETADAPFDKEQFISQFVTEVVAHELGHCLGLRHNFIASTRYSLAELADPNVVRSGGVTSTVMEYTPFNIAAIRRKNVPFYSPVVGEYDRWAISYGYSAVPGAATPEAEKPALAAIASLGEQPGHRYQSDGVVNAYDPDVAVFDLGRDPLEYVERKVQVSRGLLKTLDTRLPKPGQSYYEFTRSFNGLLGGHFGAVGFATRYIGGMHLSSSRRGDPNGKLPQVPINAAQQKRALRLIADSALSESAFAFPPRVFKMLGADPNSSENYGYEVDAEARRYPIRDRISAFQRTTLAALLSPNTQNRVANTEYRAEKPGEALTLAGLHRVVGAAVWSELDKQPGAAGAKAAEIGALRRDLQRAHLDALIDSALGRRPTLPRDAVSLSWDQLRGLRTRIAAALPAAGGEYTRPHLAECLTRIDRALNAATLTAN